MHINLEEIISFLSHEPAVTAVYLFGSAAKGNATEKSDIDLALILEENFDYLANFDYKLKLTGKLEDMTGKTVDVVFMDKANPILQHQIRKYGRVIFERDRIKRIAAEVLSRKRYFDYLPMHKKYMEGILHRSGR